MAARRWVKGVTRDFLRTAFRDYFGVKDQQAEVLVTLWEERHRAITSKRLAEAVNRHRPPKGGVIWECIRGLRAVMACESIDTTNEGYLLTDVGVAECIQAIRHMATVLASESAIIEVEPLVEGVIAPSAEAAQGPETMAA